MNERSEENLLTPEFIRQSAKAIVCDNLNTNLIKQGRMPVHTVEQISAIAAARVRKQQKKSKKKR